MVQQGSPVLQSVENNFTKGLITEFTALNFPENAATDCDNCEFTLIGDTLRRQGIKSELNGTTNVIDRTGVAVSEYKWNNAGGDGLNQVVVNQVGSKLYFYRSSIATVLAPLSTTKLVSTVDLASFATAAALTFDPTLECRYADGNGFLFVYQATMDPLYCTYVAGTITANTITVKQRDFVGAIDGLEVSTRPSTLDDPHLYNLQNQGWTKSFPWQAVSNSSATVTTGVKVFAVAAGITNVTVGDTVTFTSETSSGGGLPVAFPGVMTGILTAYSGTNMTFNVLSVNPTYATQTFTLWVISPTGRGYISTWHTAVGNYPSNADVWWYFKNASNVFDPATTKDNISFGLAQGPQGHYVLNSFNQTRSTLSSVSNITNVTTTARPTSGTWFQGRVWYTGVDATQAASGTSDFSTWTENIYFSQIVKTPSDFGNCYQLNDPTSENLFGLLPTDGGVITIQGSGSIYKLWPLQNVLVVFAANGVWYIAGSQGLGFAANDYTVIKLSSVKSISGTSFVDVQGLPYFWNEEGIYSVEPAKQGAQLPSNSANMNVLMVNPITVGTILSFYNAIPLSSKKYARAAYHPIDYRIQWIYRDTEATNVTGRYTFNKILNFNTYNKAFYPYSIDASASAITGILYVDHPGGTGAPLPTIKYVYSNGTSLGFAEEYDTTYVDWGSINYHSYFVTGYKLHGQGQRKFQMPYVNVYSRLGPVSYFIQSLWDFSTSGNSGRWSAKQLKTITDLNYGVGVRRHRLRGRGLALQIKVSSVDGQPFDVMGWSAFEVQNLGI